MDSHKLLTGDLELDPELETFLKEGKWSACTNYVTVSIIGAQGTGKSTLMNSIFGTDFTTKRRNGYKSKTAWTTVGADLEIIKEAEDKFFLLIDSEGIGNNKRHRYYEDYANKRSTLETQLTSFILSTVDVLIINIMLHQIGHEMTKWQTLIHDIMEINTKYINTKDKRRKTIIYAIRDFHEDEYDKDGLREIIIKGFFEESDEGEDEFEEYNWKYRSKSIEKYKSFEIIQEKYNIKFEFLCHFWLREDFLDKSKNIKAKILRYFEKDSKLPEIRSLASRYKENLKSIIKNYSYSADELKIFYLEIERKQIETWDYVKEEIEKYSDLEKFIINKESIVKDWVEIYKSKIRNEFYNYDVYHKNMKNLIKKTNELLKKRLWTLFNEEINQFINMHSTIIQKEIALSYLFCKPLNFKNLKQKKIKNFISNMIDHKLQRDSNQSLKIDLLEENIQNYTNLLRIINFIVQNWIEWFSKYIDKKLNNEESIFSKLRKDYIIAYSNSLKKYITEIKKYIIKNYSDLIMIGQKKHDQEIDQILIDKMFNNLINEVLLETEKILIKTKNTIRDNFKKRWIKISNDKYNEILKEIESNYQNYYNDNLIDEKSENCIKEIFKTLYNFWSIIVPGLSAKAHTFLIDDFLLVDNVKKEIEHTWNTQLTNLKIRIEKQKLSNKFLKTLGLTAAAVGLACTGGLLVGGAAYIIGNAATASVSNGVSVHASVTPWIDFTKYLQYSLEKGIDCKPYINSKININEFTIKYTLDECNINFIE